MGGHTRSDFCTSGVKGTCQSHPVRRLLRGCAERYWCLCVTGEGLVDGVNQVDVGPHGAGASEEAPQESTSRAWHGPWQCPLGWQARTRQIGSSPIPNKQQHDMTLSSKLTNDDHLKDTSWHAILFECPQNGCDTSWGLLVPLQTQKSAQAWMSMR